MMKFCYVKTILALAAVLATTASAAAAPPEYFGSFRSVPISEISPRGWLKTYLENQRDGLTGHAEELGFPFDSVGWRGKVKRDFTIYPKQHKYYREFWPYETTGYWLDGVLRTAHLLDDDALLEKATDQIEAIVPEAGDGLEVPEKSSLYTQAVFFKALIAHQEATGSERLLNAMHAYLLTLEPERMQHTRDGMIVQTILWAYGKTGDERLLELAKKGFRKNATPDKETFADRLMKRYDWRFTLYELEEFPFSLEHGVTYLEKMKPPVLLYQWTGASNYKAMSEHAYRILDRYHMLVDGAPSSQEFLHGNEPNSYHETCDIAEFIYSGSFYLEAFGDASIADDLERAALNAGPSVVTKDFTSHQYMSGPNLVTATSDTKDRQDKYAYHGGHTAGCCTGNVNRIVPNYAAHLWLRDAREGRKGGIVAAMYGPSRIDTRAGADPTPVSIVEKTHYPFDDEVTFVFEPETPTEFPFSFRIPGWSKGVTVTLNGEKREVAAKPGSFHTVERTFESGDELTVRFEMEVEATYWGQGGDHTGVAPGIALERGPLVYTLDIDEKVTPYSDPDRPEKEWPDNYPVVRRSDRLPALNVEPAGPWNYALAVDPANPEAAVEVERRDMPANPWIKDTTPLRLKVPARRVEGWDLLRIKNPWTGERKRITPPIPPEPDLASERETVTFVPYGATLIRMTIFPRAASGDER